MMPGVAAQPLRRSSSGGGGGITNSWSLDFINEVYTLNGSPVTLADIIDKPERVGASGLEILDHDAAGSIFSLAGWLADLAEFVAIGGTIYIEWESLSAGDRDVPLYMEEDTDANSFDIERTFPGFMRTYASGSDYRGVDTDTDFGPGVHKIAVTYTPSFIAMSIDGADALVDTTPNVMQPMMRAILGGFEASSNNGLYYRRITLTAPVANSLLPGLTA
ncbi:hypothetical protein NKI61_20085 [Mesorhizobium sp. M0514]|uniref:hypothetical protein n=1 Tax=Mesorhizobium sp. M0514 TaxID=2956955 RepID=UPI00333AC284